MENGKSKIVVLYDESRINEESFLEHIVEPYLYFLAENRCIDPSKEPTSLYEKVSTHGSLKGFEVECCAGFNNRFPQFKWDFGKFDLQRLATGVFYIGQEISLNQLTPNLGEIFILYNRKTLTDKGLTERMLGPYFQEINKAVSQTNKKLKKLPVKSQTLYDDLRSVSMEDESISLKSLGLLAHSRKVDLRFLSNEVGFIYKLRTSNGEEGGSDGILTLFPFGKRGYCRNVSDSRNSS
ncbi:hypothetical protein COU57_03260 [Candidatus Pacearchaeota archaeon CG10_big_fil_rev_8_21_14_0_10_32_14]|nr:MAG: hypothetical protein COU57_03260 [Candidatus Pacearchaeota archaeon CG10_big_fil_rev_8_21_14_0_10_32_14]